MENEKVVKNNSRTPKKVLKFHNINTNEILGNKRAKKAAEIWNKNVPSEIIGNVVKDPKENVVQMIFNQYVPIRKKCFPLELIQTKESKTEILPRTSTKPKMCLKPSNNERYRKQNKRKPNTKPKLVPNKNSLTECDNSPKIRLVDISLLKDPPVAPRTEGRTFLAKQTKTNETTKCYSTWNDPNQKEITITKQMPNQIWKSPNLLENDDGPLDLRIKPKVLEDQLPLDLSTKHKKLPYESVGEPPPLIPIQTTPHNYSSGSPTLPRAKYKLKSLNITHKNYVEMTEYSEINKNCPNQASQNKDLPMLNTNPGQLVFPTFPSMQRRTSEKNKIQAFPTASKVNTRKVKTKLKETTQTKMISQDNDRIVPTNLVSPIQPIQMIFADGQFVQVLPSEPTRNMEQSDGNIDTHRKIIAKDQNQEKQNHDRYTVPTDTRMVKTNETVTSNGGLFCTFKNMKLIKMLRTKNKPQKKKGKADSLNVMN